MTMRRIVIELSTDAPLWEITKIIDGIVKTIEETNEVEAMTLCDMQGNEIGEVRIDDMGSTPSGIKICDVLPEAARRAEVSREVEA